MQQAKTDEILIKLRIVPNSSKNDIIVENDTIKAKVTAQPVENKANKALIELISKKFKIPKTNIEIVKGHTSKDKTILIKAVSEEKQKELKTVLNI